MSRSQASGSAGTARGAKMAPVESAADLENIKKEYNRVARSAELVNIWLISEKFEIQPDFLLKRANGDSANLSVKDSSKILPFEDNDEICGAEWNWRIDAREGRRKILSISIKYMIIYGSLEDCNEEAVHAFIRRVGRFATYPYFRARVSQLSAESGADLPILPVIST